MGWPSFNHLTGWLCGLEALHSSTSVPVSRSLLFSSFLKNLISAVTNTQNLKLALQYSTNFLNHWDNPQNFLDVKWNSFTQDKIKATGSPLKSITLSNRTYVPQRGWPWWTCPALYKCTLRHPSCGSSSQPVCVWSCPWWFHTFHLQTIPDK